jgi:VanZ family protein
MPLNSLLIRLYKKIKSNPIAWIHFPLLVYWILLFIATSIPIDRMPNIFKAQDKVEHFSAYFVLGLLLKISLHFQNLRAFFKRREGIYSSIIIILYASIDELHQLIIPGRYCDFYDWLFDIIGGIAGIFLINYLLIRHFDLSQDLSIKS